MKILSIARTAPTLPGFSTRLECDVAYDDGHSESLWAEVAGAGAEGIAGHVDPWAVALLPLAVTLGEPLQAGDDIDDTLLTNLNSLQRVWHVWYPDLPRSGIEADTTNRFISREPRDQLTACFFSGGVDSFHALSKSVGEQRVLDLHGIITVWGFDIPLDKPQEFSQLRALSDSVAASLNLESTHVATNLRESRFGDTDWGLLSHGCALAFVAHLLNRRYDRVLVGSTLPIPDIQPWGSSVITDPLCSSSTCQIVHFGATESRVEKFRSLVDFPLAMKHLRVCWEKQNAGNCGQCTKCLRAMATISLFAELDASGSFGDFEFSPDKLANAVIKDDIVAADVIEIAKAAAAQGNDGIAAAANTALRRYAVARRVGPVSAYLRRKSRSAIRRLPLLWRLSE